MHDKFSLKWHDFETNISNSFRKLRNTDDFYDVTLVSDDQEQMLAHKVVLSASSEYFNTVLKSNKHSHPMICLNGINSIELTNILDYIYRVSSKTVPTLLFALLLASTRANCKSWDIFLKFRKFAT